MTRSLDPVGLSRPEAFVESRFRDRYREVLRARGLCVFCQHRETTFGVVHCQHRPDRQKGKCQTDGQGPQFRVDAQMLEEIRNAA